MSSPPPNSKPPVETTPVTAEEHQKQGLEALKEGRYEEAVASFDSALEQRVTEHGELAPECALAYYYYGLALLREAQSSQEVFAQTEPEQAEGDEAAPTDLSLSWEALECARHGFEKVDPVDPSSLADVHVALGDNACESSNFEAALAEFEKAITHLNTCPEQSTAPDPKTSLQRRFCEVNYKMCLASEFLEDPESAYNYCEKAIAAIQLEMTHAESSSVTELQEIEADLKERKETIQISIQEMAQVKNMMRQIFQQNLPAASERPSDNAPVDLGVVGRGKHRIRLDKIEEEEKPPPTPRKRPSAKEEHSTDHDAAPSTKKSKKDEKDPKTARTV